MNLSEHFTLEEFCSSQVAARMGRAIVPDDEAIGNLKHLCVSVLEPARVLLGRPFVITSGFRPRWLNALIGGAPTSAHMFGRAADIHVPGMSPKAFAQWLVRRDLPFDQVIEEFGQWVHVAVAPFETQPRREYLAASVVDGKTVYTRAA